MYLRVVHTNTALDQFVHWFTLGVHLLLALLFSFSRHVDNELGVVQRPYAHLEETMESLVA